MRFAKTHAGEHRSNRAHTPKPGKLGRAVPASMPPIAKVVLLAWAFLFINFFFGPNLYPGLGFTTVLYIGLVILAFISGAFFGARSFHVSDHMRPSYYDFEGSPLLKRWIPWVTVGSWISAVGSVSGFILKIKAGRSIETAIMDTAIVRAQEIDDPGFASVFSNAFGFLSYSWLLIAFLLCRYNGGWRNNKFPLLGASVGVGAILALYFVNADRTAFLVLLLFGLSYVAIVERGDWRSAYSRLGKTEKITASAVALICLFYIGFIAVARAYQGENEAFAGQYMTLRYHFDILERLNANITFGLYKLQWYASHQISNFDQLFQKADYSWFNVDGRFILAWPYTQIARWFPSVAIFLGEAGNNWTVACTQAGVHNWQWSTSLMGSILDFGSGGTIFLCFLIGVLLASSYRAFAVQGSVIAMLLCYWVSGVALLLFINYPIDNFFQTNLFLCFFMNLASWPFSRR